VGWKCGNIWDIIVSDGGSHMSGREFHFIGFLWKKEVGKELRAFTMVSLNFGLEVGSVVVISV